MEIKKKQQEVRSNIFQLQMAMQEGIDKICKEKDYNITYAEINAALSQILKSNTEYELRDLWKDS